MRRLLPPVLAGLVIALACVGDTPDSTDDVADEVATDSSPARSVELGPVDGRDLPPSDLERVAVGDVAPDFSLASWRGETLTLSEGWREKEILLVFYRGHW